MKLQNILFIILTLVSISFCSIDAYALQKTKDYLIIVTLTNGKTTVIAEKIKYNNLDQFELDKILKAYKEQSHMLDSTYRIVAVAIPILTRD